ncbi:hypothetical protein [Parvularcula maris]|uniref:Lipoprotein n=1 Tax=Parvularcula maris TaxID=2965077 RepID=A0A9X2RJ71_9PROT|nr:hypothetical protein [Parvularcula maris]MCQ8184383.1 hypothetical protein [Parvularcula maris]
MAGMRNLIGGALLLAACGSEAGVVQESDLPEEMQDILPEGLASERTPVEIRDAKCLLWPSNFRGACKFEPRGRGSFAVTLEEGDMFYDDVSEILVSVFLPGEADVRALTTTGGSTYVGEAKRSESYPACWIGKGFSVCAY